MLAGAIGIVAWLFLAPASAPRTVVLPTPRFAVTMLDGPGIMRHRGAFLTVFRMAENPGIMVLDFASLHEQGQMLNRIAAMVEKNGMPHDRVLDDAELDGAIRGKGLEPDTFYFGHDYGGASLATFFAAADRQHIALTPEEGSLRALLRQEHPQALISLPQPDPAHQLDASMREAIYKHERSHGEFFSNPAYAAFAVQFWNGVLTAQERSGFRHYLASEDYDPAIEELMVNETQAYLMHTRDSRFFDPAAAGLTPASLDRLRGIFLVTMPPNWLRDCFAPAALR